MEAISETSTVVYCGILLTMFMHGCFWCLVLRNKVMAKNDFSNKTCVSYIKQNVLWASTFVLLLVHNNKVSLAKNL